MENTAIKRDRNGRFTIGTGGGPGRGAGNPEKITKNAREILVAIMDKQVPHIEAALDEVRQKDAKEYLDTIAKLLPFVLPKMEQVDAEISNTNLELSDFMESLTYEQLFVLKHNRWPERLRDDLAPGRGNGGSFPNDPGEDDD
ncbi:MAG: hypothetical protein PHD61_05655 [Bacteroidales bacterium]|nr:hypothetical protein [Lentimicrobiaceae bacterium]MDD5694771.1 hypothetical protein [Bacteroidales bacterium]